MPGQFKIRCGSCGQIYHTTTGLFIKGKTWHGAMFRLLPEYGSQGMNWSSFPEEAHIRDADLECPGCGSVYTRSTVKLIPEPLIEEAQEKAGAKGPQGKTKGKVEK